MIVSELIAKLSELPGDLDAVVPTGDCLMSYRITDVRSTLVCTGHSNPQAINKVVIESLGAVQ